MLAGGIGFGDEPRTEVEKYVALLPETFETAAPDAVSQFVVAPRIAKTCCPTTGIAFEG